MLLNCYSYIFDYVCLSVFIVFASTFLLNKCTEMLSLLLHHMLVYHVLQCIVEFRCLNVCSKWRMARIRK